MAISLQEARGIFTKKLIAVYSDRLRPTSFLRSFFPGATAPTRYVSIEVERNLEKIAVDVMRGTEGNRNKFSHSVEKIFEPPMYREFFDLTQEDLYDRVIGSETTDNSRLFAALINRTSDRLGLLQDKIERAIELQCANVLETGIVTVNTGDNIDFKRKAASMVDLTSAGGYFAANSDVFAQFEAGCNFLRTVGKSGDSVFHAILGATAMQHLLANTVFLGRQNLHNLRLDSVLPQTRSATGSSYHGSITAGSYTVHLWTYPQFYDNATNTATAYVNAKKVFLIPTMPKFKTAFAAVPRLIGDGGVVPIQGEFVIGDFRDERNAVHDFDIQSAPLVVPVAVDQIYTMKAVTG